MAKIITSIVPAKDGGVEKHESLDFSEEIHRGMAFLDMVEPGWENLIDPAVLDVACATSCVCGQVFEGHFEEGSVTLRDWLRAQVHEDEQEDHPLVGTFAFDNLTAAYGFNIYDWDSPESQPLREWSLAYLADGADIDDERVGYSEADERVLFSTLTEQWLFEINFRRGLLTPVVLDATV